jgi:hypothetical protein
MRRHHVWTMTQIFERDHNTLPRQYSRRKHVIDKVLGREDVTQDKFWSQK